jgi:outer membrane receptor protein involved in Fe transport
MHSFKKIVVAGSLSLVGLTAFAQDSESGLEEVLVTGSRIVDSNVFSASQIATVSGEDIEQRGITRVEDYLNDLPQISPGQSVTNSNGASGTATVNLRNLGCSRTLVLLNGKRMPPGTAGGSSCADLNAVPSLLIERVEVLTGGASSVYGSDAVAGVVNFILNDEFEGFKASYTNSFYTHSNDDGRLRDLVDSYDYERAPGSVTTGETEKFSVAFGGPIFDGRGHVTAYAERTDTEAILQGDYDISACALSGGTSRCGGSSTIPPGRWADFGLYGALGFVNVDPSVTRLDLKVFGNEFVPRDGQTFNYNPTNFFQRPDKRTNTGFFGKYELTDNVEAYASLRIMESESNAQIAFSGTFGNITRLPCYNAFLSEQQYDTVCGDWTGMGGDHAPNFTSAAEALGYIASLDQAVAAGDIIDYGAPLYSLKRNVEGNPRQSIFKYTNAVTEIGLRGDINDDWRFDISYQNAEVDYQNEYRNDLSVTAINRAVDVVNINGVPTCVSALNGSDSACIPYNLFQGGLAGDAGIQGVIDGGAELQQYIANATYVNGDSKQTVLSAFVSGDTGISIPGAPSSISLAVGYEMRELSTSFRPDRPSRTGDRSGSGGATLPLAGDYDVEEVYAELGVPITDGLSVEAGYRYSDYSTGATTDTWKLGGYWQINDDVSLRTTFQTATRHANLSELYRAIGAGLVDLDDDPCSGSRGAPSATSAQCELTGLDPSLYGSDLTSPADQYNIQVGGNVNVNPEEAESFTAGVVFTPSAIEGLTITADFFDITVTEGIGTVSAKTALDKCIETGQSTYCDLINRNPINGSLWLTGGYISQQITNIAEENLQGVDLIFDYSFKTALGNVNVEGVTTFLSSQEVIELPGEAAIECAGNWGGSCGKNPLPEVSGNYRATLSTEYDTDVTLGIRYLGATDDLNSNQIDFDAFTYVDLTVVYRGFENFEGIFGVSNLMDKDPAVTSDAGTAPGNGNTFPGYFDALGRYVYVTLNANF